MRGDQPASGTELTHNLRLVRPLGRGGMGVLWIAEHRTLGNEVVVKFLSDELTDEPSIARRIAREAAAAARIKSPHVVHVFDHGVSPGGVPFIVMELLVGCDLRGYLEARGPLTIREATAIVHQLAKALDKTHAAGIVHRDVKPSNIFLCDFDTDIFVKLLDFGLARHPASPHASSTGSQHCAGTPPYMSPEQIVGGDVGPWSDIWSLGVVAFECLTGKRAFAGETLGAVALAIHTFSLPTLTEIRPELPPAIDAWFRRACARSSDERFGSAMEAADAMAQALGVDVPPVRSRPVISTAPSDDRISTDDFTLTRAPASRRVRPRRALSAWVAAGASAVAMALTVGGVYHAAVTSGPPPPVPLVVHQALPSAHDRDKAPAPPDPTVSAAEQPPSSPATTPPIASRASTVVRKAAQPAATPTAPPSAAVADPSPRPARDDDLPDERY